MKLRHIRTILKSVVLAAILFFVGRHVWRQWHAVEQASAPDAVWLAGATLAALGAMLITVVAYRALIEGHGVRIAYCKTIAIYYLPLLGKYVPGKIWTVVAAFEMYHGLGISRKIAAASIALFMALGLAAGVLVALTFGGVTAGVSTSISAAVVLVPILAVVLWPRAFYGTLSGVLRLVGREAILTRLCATTLLRVLTIFIAARVTYGIAFCLVVASVAPVGLLAWPGLIAMFTFAQIAGVLALFAPAGIGVREGVLLVGLGPIVGPGPAIVITGVTRLWQTALELLMAAIGWWALRRADVRILLPEDADREPSGSSSLNAHEATESPSVPI